MSGKATAAGRRKPKGAGRGSGDAMRAVRQALRAQRRAAKGRPQAPKMDASRAFAVGRKAKKREADEDDDEEEEEEEEASSSSSSGGDSGDDTDDLISLVRSSGRMKKGKPAAATSKKRKGEAGGAVAGEADADGKLKIDFTFFDPRENDYHGAKNLLRPFHAFGDAKTPFDTEGLADVVTAQAAVGSMIKNEDGEEQPLGFATVVSLHLHKDKQWARQVRSFVLAKAKGKARKAFAAAFADAKRPLGLYLSERLVNVPAPLVPDLHASVLKDLEWARENEITPELRAACNYRRVLLVSRLFHNRDSAEAKLARARAAKAASSGGDAPPSKKKRRKDDAAASEAAAAAAAAADGAAEDDGVTHYRWEDESFEAVATANVRFTRPVGEHEAGIEQVYSISLLPMEQLRAVIAAIPRHDDGDDE